MIRQDHFPPVASGWYAQEWHSGVTNMPPPGLQPTTEIALFGRLLSNGRAEMSADLAAYVLNLGFDEQDQARMADLAERNQAGALSAEEQQELTSFVRAGHLLALLQSRARQALAKKRAS